MEIRKTVETDILHAMRVDAKTKASKMSENQLRQIIDALLENSVEACMFFADKN